MRLIPRFSLRTLLIAVAVCAAFMGRLLTERSAVKERQQLKEKIRSAGGMTMSLIGSTKSVAWTHRLLGDMAIDSIRLPESLSHGDQYRSIMATFPEAEIEMIETQHVLEPATAWNAKHPVRR